MKVAGGEFKGRTIKCPSGDTTRPTTAQFRESLFNIVTLGLGHEMHHVLDMFAGTGSLTIEAFSRGALSAVLIEEDKKALQVIRANMENFSIASNTEVISHGRWHHWGKDLAKCSSSFKPFDTVFADAPYEKGLSEKVLRLFGKTDYRELFADRALWILETSSREKLEGSYGYWKQVDRRSKGDTALNFFRIL